VYSQGQVSMNDYNGAFAIQVFTQQSAAASTVAVSYGGFSGFEQMGATANSGAPAVPQGTTTYANAPLGTGYSLQLLAAPGLSDPIGNLTPVGALETVWYGGSYLTGLGGFWNDSGTPVAIPGTTTTATVALGAWNNEGGTVTSLAQAQAGGDPWGVSTTGNINALGFGTIQPPNLPTSIQSFSLATTVPEPSTIALGVIGASAFLMRLRRKQ